MSEQMTGAAGRPEQDWRALFDGVEAGFAAAIVSNDPERIAGWVEPEWCLVEAAAGPVSRAGFLEAVASGRLSHDSMSMRIDRIQVYDGIAVVTGRGQNTARFKGAPLLSDEWITNVYRLRDGRWRCTLTHLTPVAGEGGADAG